MGVCTESISAWEAGQMPSDRLWPKVLGFLGYDPSPTPRTLGEKLQAARRRAGLSIKGLAARIGCDEETVAKWERDSAAPSGAHARAIRQLLGR